MIESIISSLVVIIAVLFGDYLSSLTFGTNKGLKENIAELLLFLLLLNLFLFNILVPEQLFIKLFVYFLVSFVSIIASRSVVYLLLNKLPVKLLFTRNTFNSKSIKLAKLLNKKLIKSDVIKLFQNSGYSSALLEHLDKILE